MRCRPSSKQDAAKLPAFCHLILKVNLLPKVLPIFAEDRLRRLARKARRSRSFRAISMVEMGGLEPPAPYMRSKRALKQEASTTAQEQAQPFEVRSP